MRPEPLPAGAAGAPILVVEDNDVNAMILRAMLRKHGYEPVLAKNGEEGIEMSRRYRPGLVLMDLQMPRLDGFAAASAIRAAGGGPVPAIVAVTANAAADVREACRAAGFVSVLAKPIVLEELIATVRQHLHAS